MKAPNLDGYFDVVVGSDNVSRGKRAPDMVLEACKKAGLNPKDSIMIGDSRVDMVMRKNAKVRSCIGVLSGFTP